MARKLPEKTGLLQKKTYPIAGYPGYYVRPLSFAASQRLRKLGKKLTPEKSLVEMMRACVYGPDGEPALADATDADIDEMDVTLANAIANAMAQANGTATVETLEKN